MAEHGCEKEMELGEIRATLRFFQEAEKRRESREERMATAMETVAAQGKIIEAHAEALSRHEKTFENLFARVRELEIAEPAAPVVSVVSSPEGEEKSFVVQVYRSKAGPYILAVLVAGFLVGVGTNYDAVAKVAKLILT